VVGTATGLVDPANCPAAAVDGVVRSVLTDPGTEAGRAKREGLPLLLRHFECDDDLFPGLQVFQLNHTVGISGLQDLRGQ
jgi:hypothetical protein